MTTTHLHTLGQRLRGFRTRLLLILAVIGPGIITANVDNDAGGIATYSVAGANYGFDMLSKMILVAIALVVVQEMSARLGVVTGKGLSSLIRENMGARGVAIVLGILLLANIANTVSEFAGIAASMEIFGVTKFVSVPIAAVGVWLLVVRGNYRTVERVFLVASAIYLTYIASGILAHPDWSKVLRATVTPTFSLESGYIIIFITIIGTTIAPWMQFYQQSAIADKGIQPADYPYERLDVIVGCIFAVVVAAFIVIACAGTLFVQGLRIDGAEDAAVALRPLAGPYASTLFAIGLLNASVFAAAILPLSTAYAICEAFGWESAINRRFQDAPAFFGIYTGMIILGAGVILLPIKSLVQAMMASQTLNGLLLPIILVIMLRLVNDRALMGRYANGRLLNIVSWTIVGALILLTVILVLVTLFPGLAG
jgi:Mn2+/Fe2+ NRAMP family transporter